MKSTRAVGDRQLRRARLKAARSRQIGSINRVAILGGEWDMGAVVRAHMKDGTARPGDTREQE